MEKLLEVENPDRQPAYGDALALSREMKLLLLCIGGPAEACAGQSAASAVGEGVDWNALLALADRHRVIAPVYDALKNSEGLAVPAEVIEALGARHRENALRAMSRAAETARLAETFQRQGIPVLAFKGTVLAQALYGDITRRHAGDIDLLIPTGSLARADSILRERGFRPRSRVFYESPKRRAAYVRGFHHLPYWRETDGIVLELHWRLHSPRRLFPRDFEALHARRIMAEMAGRQVPTPSLEDAALDLFVHGATHFWYRLFWLCDVAKVLASGRLGTGEALLAEAGQLGIARPVVQGWILAHQLLGAPLPEAVRRATDSDPAVRFLVQRALEHIRGGREMQEHGGLKAFVRDWPYLVRLRRDASYKMNLVAEKFLSPYDWLYLPLPDRLFFLYYILRPVLWIPRRLTKWNQRVDEI